MRSERLLTQLHQKRNLDNSGSIEFLYYRDLQPMEFSKDNQRLSSILESDYYFETHYAYPVNFPKLYDQSLTGGEVVILVNGKPIDKYTENNGFINYSLKRPSKSDYCLLFKREKKVNPDGTTYMYTETHETAEPLDVTVIMLKNRHDYYKVRRGSMTDDDAALLTDNYSYMCIADTRVHINEDALVKSEDDTFIFFKDYKINEVAEDGLCYLPDRFNDGESVFVRDVVQLTPSGNFISNVNYDGDMPEGVTKPKLINDHTIFTENGNSARTYVMWTPTDSATLLDITKDVGLLKPDIFSGMDTSKLEFPYQIEANKELLWRQSPTNQNGYNRLMNSRDTDSEFLSGLLEEPKVVYSYTLSESDYSLDTVNLIKERMMYDVQCPSIYLCLKAPLGFEPVLYIDGLRKPQDNFLFQLKNGMYHISIPVTVFHPTTTEWGPFDRWIADPFSRTYAQYKRFRDRLTNAGKFDRRYTIVFEDRETMQEYNYLTMPFRERMIELPFILSKDDRYEKGNYELYLNGEYIPPDEVRCIEIDDYLYLEFKRYVPLSSMLTVLTYDETIVKEEIEIPKNNVSKLIDLTWAPYTRYNSKIYHKGRLVSDDVFCKYVAPSLTSVNIDTSNSKAYESENYFNLALADKVEDNYGLISFNIESKTLTVGSTDVDSALADKGYFSQSGLLRNLNPGNYELQGVLKNNYLYEPSENVNIFVRYSDAEGVTQYVESPLPKYTYGDFKLAFTLDKSLTDIEVGVKSSFNTKNKSYALTDVVLTRVIDIPDVEHKLYIVRKSTPLDNKNIRLTEYNIHDLLWREVRLKGSVEPYTVLDKSNVDSFVNLELEVKSYEKQVNYKNREVNSYITPIMKHPSNASYVKSIMDAKLLPVDWLYTARRDWFELAYYNLVKDVKRYCEFIGDVELTEFMNNRISEKYMEFVNEDNRIILYSDDERLDYRIFYCRTQEDYDRIALEYDSKSGKTLTDQERAVLNYIYANGVPTEKEVYVAPDGTEYTLDTGRYVRPVNGELEITEHCLVHRPLEMVPYV